MPRKLIKREQAKRDLIDLADAIAQDNLDAAERFLGTIPGGLEIVRVLHSARDIEAIFGVEQI